LIIHGVRDTHTYPVTVDTCLRQAVDYAIIATKTHDILTIIRDNSEFLKEVSFLLLQNGVVPENLMREIFPDNCIIPSIIRFVASYISPNSVAHNREGDLIVSDTGGLEKNGNKAFLDSLNSVFNVVKHS